MELLLPATTLRGVAIEGFSAEDAATGLSQEAHDIADLVRYRGSTEAASATAVEVVQFKYSVAHTALPMRAADIAKTLTKFAKTEADFIERFGRDHVERVVTYEIVTNRPFHPSLFSSVDRLRRGAMAADPDEAAQSQAVVVATGLAGAALSSFLSRLALTGEGGALAEVNAAVHRTLADWGGASDALAQMRLDGLRTLVHEKAGIAGQHTNVIDRIAVLGALGVANENDLFPTPEAFPPTGSIIDRSLFSEIVNKVDEASPPLLIHSAGGVGKTVLMQAIAQHYEAAGAAVVVFDCYGAGRWRDPADSRHLPRRAFLHIANLLAGRGLCDVLLPSTNPEDLTRAFRERLVQAARTLRRGDSAARLVLVLDAIDHAAMQAGATGSQSFAHLLLQSLSISPVEGLAVVASSRTERRDQARGGALCRLFEIPAFSAGETRDLVLTREPTATDAEVAALHTRSGGNPRCLDALLRTGRPFDGPAPGTGTGQLAAGDALDALIRQEIEAAEHRAIEKGATERDVCALLAGLALLPPPVPGGELAAAHGLSEAAIESFAADLHPLLDRTPYGLIFRDEPTETIIHSIMQGDPPARETVIQRLHDRQTTSTYAARALPVVLTSLGRTDELVDLAFDDRLPRSATSRVAKRGIRLARLVAALLACASEQEQRADDLIKLMLEAARVSGGHERSDRFLQEFPDLAACSGDAEALRRLFEAPASWPGARHGSLSIAHAFADDEGEARRNARRAFGWLSWREQQQDEPVARYRERDEDRDWAFPAYVELLYGDAMRVGRWINRWPEPEAFALFGQLASLLERHSASSSKVALRRDAIVVRASRCRVKSRALPAAMLQLGGLSIDQVCRLTARLAEASRASKPARDVRRGYHAMPIGPLNYALLAAAIKGARHGLLADAVAILDGIDAARPRLYQFDQPAPLADDLVLFMLTTGARAALERRDPDLADLVPSEIVQAIRSRSASSSASTDVQVTVETIEALLKEPSGDYGAGRTAKPNDGLSYQQREEARRTIQHRVRPLLSYAQAAADVIRRDREPHEVLEQALARLETDLTGASEYPYRDSRYYIAKIGFAVLFTVANAVGSLSAETARGLVEWLVKSPVVRQSSLWIDVVSHLAQRDATQETALSLAQNTHELICENTDVSERVSAYGQLARAVWCASLSDAQAYFRRGLDIADAIGSDDQDKARQLVQFGACYSGPMLAPQIVHDFVRMCELNLAYEPEKTFDWVDVGRALSRLAGIASLALVARLSDRETVDLRWSLPPLLTALVEDGHLAPNLAAGLIGVAEPAETWSWRLGDFVSAVFPRLAPATREIVANNLLQELDRQHLATPPQSTLDRLIAELRPQLEEPSPALARLAQLKFEADLEHAVEKKGTWALPDAEHFTVDGPQASGATSAAELDKALAGIDLSDATDIDALLVTEQSGQAGRSNPAFLLNRLTRRARHPDDRRRFLRAICKTTIPSLGDKLSGVRDVISQWRAQSPAAKDELPGLGIDLATRHALDLIGTSWEVSYELRELQELSQARGVDLVAAIIRALRDDVLNVRSATWLAFANLSVGLLVRDVFVPEEHTFSFQDPQLVKRPGPLYAFPFMFIAKGPGATLGIARHAINALTETAAGKPARRYTLGERVEAPKALRDEVYVQDAVGRAETLLTSARAHAFDVVGDLWASLLDEREPTERQLALFTTLYPHVAAVCVEVVQLVYKAVGGGAVYRKGPLDRCLRDILTANQHVVATVRTYEMAGRLLLGLEPLRWVF